MPRTVQRRIAVVVTSVALLLLAGRIGVTAGDDPPKAAPPGDETKKTLVFLARIKAEKDKPMLSGKDLEGTFTEGLSSSKNRCDLPIKAKSITPATFLSLAEGVEPPSAVPDEDLTIRPMINLLDTWEIQCKPGKRLLKLEVLGKNGKWRDPPHTPANSSDKPQAALTQVLQGSYALRVDADDMPVKYKATLKTSDKEYTTPETDWPLFDRYYIIILKNFQGDESDLLDAITVHKDGKNRVGSPLTYAQMAKEMKLVFAGLGADPPLPPDIFAKNTYTTTIATLDGRKDVRRVWILFPLNDETEKTKKRYENSKEAAIDKYGKMTSRELSDAIKESGPITANGKVEITSTMKPTWIELIGLDPDKETNCSLQFSRGLPLKDLRALQAEFPRVSKLVVWEFQGKDAAGKDLPPVAISLIHPQSRQFVRFMDQEVKEWPLGIKTLVDADKKPLPKDNKDPGK